MEGWGCKPQQIALPSCNGVTNLLPSRRTLERATADGDSPVSEREGAPAGELEYHGTREILWEAGGTTSQG